MGAVTAAPDKTKRRIRMTDVTVQNAPKTAIKAIALCSALLVAGCATTPVSQNAGPGSVDADPALAAQIFNDVCLNGGPAFSAAPAAVATFPFTQSAGTGTYFHNTQNLSVKLIGTPANECSIVFAVSTDPVQKLVTFMETLNAIAPDDDSTVSLGDTRGPDGKTYLNARLSRS